MLFIKRWSKVSKLTMPYTSSMKCHRCVSGATASIPVTEWHCPIIVICHRMNICNDNILIKYSQLTDGCHGDNY